MQSSVHTELVLLASYPELSRRTVRHRSVGLGLFDMLFNTSGSHFEPVQTKHSQLLACIRSYGHAEEVHFENLVAVHGMTARGLWPTAGR